MRRNLQKTTLFSDTGYLHFINNYKNTLLKMFVPLVKAGYWQGAEIYHWRRNTGSALPSASPEPPHHP